MTVIVKALLHSSRETLSNCLAFESFSFSDIKQNKQYTPQRVVIRIVRICVQLRSQSLLRVSPRRQASQ